MQTLHKAINDYFDAMLEQSTGSVVLDAFPQSLQGEERCCRESATLC